MFFVVKICAGLSGFLLIGNNLISNLSGMVVGIVVCHIVELAVCHYFNNGKRLSEETLNLQERQECFFDSVFSVMGYIAKTKDMLIATDIQVANVYLDLIKLQEANPVLCEFNLLNALQTTNYRVKIQQSLVEEKDSKLLNSLQTNKHCMQAHRAFSEGKKDSFSLSETLHRLILASNNDRNILQIFLGIQIQLAYTYGKLHCDEKSALHRIGEHLAFSPVEVNRLVRIIGQQQRFYQPKQQQESKSNYYQILGIKNRATEKEIKRAYRKQMSQYHPDKLASKALPEEMMEQAKEKAQIIQKAYEALRNS